MSKKITLELELPSLQEKDSNDIVKELQQNINDQLEIIQDRIKQNVLVDLDDIKMVLEDAEGIIEECHSTPDFKPGLYRKFSVLVFEYQRLSLRLEATSVEERMDRIDKKVRKVEEKTSNFEGSLKEFLGTLISAFLTFTLVPAAMTGISMIEGKYILPFVATLILFGIIMITYMYVINHVTINKSAKLIIILMTCLVIFLWCIVCFKGDDISLKNNLDVSKTLQEKLDNIDK